MRMTKPLMPCVNRSTNGCVSNSRNWLNLRKTNGVQPVFTWTREEGSACKLVLHRKKSIMKFEEYMIIMAKFLN
ncbi:hypothetical protein HanLR1_Chr04g0123901 [Helianthus annuus]|nr:hypothetical protein HanLR1_Chr04g0123901 [Helianthus annuus]